MQQQRHAHLEMRSAAVVLQAAWRGREARMEYARVLAAVTIQSAVRRSVARTEFVHMKLAVTTLQASWRGLVDR